MALRVLRVVFGFAGVLFLAVTLKRTWEVARGHVLPSLESATLAAAILVVAVACAAQGWAALLSNRARAGDLVYKFMVAQIGKYMPGGIWHFVGQVSFASTAGVSVATASSALTIHVFTQAVAALTLGCLIVAQRPDALASWLTVVAAAVGIAALLDHRLLSRFLTLGARHLRRYVPSVSVPPHEAIQRSLIWSCFAIVLSGAAFGFLLRSIDQDTSVLRSAAVFGLAWLGGFVAVPVPAGLGVREAVMVALLSASPGAVVSASVVHRLLNIFGELVVTAMAWTRTR